MKKLILITSTIVLLFSNLPAQVNLDSGLVAYYPFNGNANDESGNWNAEGALMGDTILGLFNTGVDENGIVQTAGSAELHYSLTGPLSPAFVINRFVGTGGNEWILPPEGSAWIGPSDGNVTDPTGEYIYTLTFDLSGFDTSTVTISGLITADNTLSVFLNGIETDFTQNPNQYFILDTLLINSGFIVGVNTLEFHVTNNPGTGLNPTGLLVSDLSADIATGISQPMEILSSYILEQNYPNPFNPSTTIRYAVSDRQFITLKVYDVLGNEVANLVNEEKPAGSYEVNFSTEGRASNLSSGIYFYKLQAGRFVETKKMILMK